MSIEKPILSLSVALTVLASTPAGAAELPTPCIAGACGGAPFVAPGGQASAVISGNTLNVTQQSQSVFLNWQSFNISRDGTVNFLQPDSNSVAVNKILDTMRPSTIAGALNANGRVYLLNRNGIIFGEGAQVKVGALLATSLDLTKEATDLGIAGAINSPIGASAALTSAAGDGRGPVTVERGATIEAPSGQVLLFAPEVNNRGTIRTPDGQTILAAGERVFLATSNDDDLRGLLVEVVGDGSVTNGEDANSTRTAAELVGRIAADRGNVTLAGMLVRQQGAVSATTSTRANGTVRLLARAISQSEVSRATEASLRGQTAAGVGGELSVGAHSSTAVTLDTRGGDETVDVNAQPRSQIELRGKRIEIGSGSSLVATGGSIDAFASSTPAAETIDRTPDDSRVIVASDARLDVSGADVSLPVDRNVIRVELRGSQLADSPQQRDGALRSDAVFVDVRRSGTRADGSSWQGTPLADVSGDIANVRRGVAERNLDGGTINLSSRGAVLIGRDAVLDVSGGVIDWQSGYINTSRVLGTDGRIYDIAEADRDRSYRGVVNGYSLTDQRWGTTTTYFLPAVGEQGSFEQGYVEGRAAGSVSILAPRMLLDGDIDGSTVAGRYQRRPRDTNPVRFDQLPRPASLLLGSSNPTDPRELVLPDVEIAPGFVLPDGVQSGELFDTLPDSLATLHLRPDLLGDDRVGDLTIRSNGTVSIAAGSPLVLPDGGNLSINAGRVAVGADIVAHSGHIALNGLETITLSNPVVDVAAGVTLDASGRWVNDDRRFNPDGATTPLWIDGGAIDLTVASGSLTLGAESVLDVTAGAQRRLDATVAGGRGGRINIAATSPVETRPSHLTLGAELRGSALRDGGALSVTTSSICITSADCGLSTPGLVLDPQWFANGGFGSISLTSDLGDLRLEQDTVLTLRQHNLELLSASSETRSGATLAELTRSTDLPDVQRRPLNLSLRAGYRGSPANSGDLRLAAGSAILADPGASISLRTDSGAFLDGTISAPGGAISVLVDNTHARRYSPTQAIWLGSGAVLDVAGTTLLEVPKLGEIRGSVLAGGTVDLTAQRGFIALAEGSLIDVSGAAAELDVGTTRVQTQRQTVASAGGAIKLTAAEGLIASGTMQARSGAPDTVIGGSLQVTLDAQNRGADTQNRDEFPYGDRTILVASSTAPIVLPRGSQLPASLQGIAHLSAGRVAAAGFDSVSLTARNVVKPPGIIDPESLGGYGRILLQPGVDLATRARLSLDAATIGIAGASGNASLASSYVSLSHGETLGTGSSLLPFEAPLNPLAGSGSLTISGGFIDLLGSVTLDGLAQTTLASRTDIRGRGVLETLDATDYRGRLTTAGSLTLQAQQIYPATLADFTFAAVGADSALTIKPVDGQASPVLSAGGHLSLQAQTIASSGVVRAPMGTIDLRAESLDLLAGSVLSTSAAGSVIPFGSTQGGLSWTHEQSNGITRVFGSGGVPLPVQDVVLDAAAVNFAPGSTIDVSGGGDLLAYEFVRGPGGSVDVLSPQARPNQFAILPGAGFNVAPYDPTVARGVNLQPGDAVWLAGGGGLAEGFYTLLPARYALLPGAFLVTSVTGYQDVAAGQSFDTLTGGTVVAGRRAISGTDLIDSRTSGFLVRSGQDALREARYDLNSANEFFPRTEPETSALRLPRDAGTVSILADTSLALQGILRATTATDGRGSTLELSAPRIAITSGETTAPAGTLAVSADQLAALGAQTLLIGGRRMGTSEGEQLDVQSSEVSVEAGVELSAPEIILTAHDRVSVGADARVSARGAAFAANDMTIGQGAALLRASTANQVNVARGDSGTGLGSVDIASGAVVAAPGSITLDVSGSARTAGSFEIGAGSLSLGADRIGLGLAPDTFTGIVVDPAVLAAVGAGSLSLAARSGLDLFAEASLTAHDLVIKTPEIRAAQPGVSASLSVNQLTLTGATTGAASAPAGDGVLSIRAAALDLGGGQMALNGFEGATLVVDGVANATRSGSLSTSADLSLSAGLITGAAGIDFAFQSEAALILGGQSITAEQAAAAPDELGARLAFSAASIDGSARVRAAGGQIELRATSGDVRLGADTVLDVSGRTVRFDDVNAAAPGGSVRIASDHGSVALAAGSTIDVSAAALANAAAGNVSVLAAEGGIDVGAALRGSAAQRANGGSIQIEAQQLDFAQVTAALGAGSFFGDWSIWRRGAGDLEVASGTSIAARSVALTADAGAIRVAGTIDASAPRGGNIVLAASGAIDVSGTLDAHGTDANVRGGRIDLLSSSGVRLASSSRLNVSGTQLDDAALSPGGRITIRAPRTAFDSVLDADTINDALRLAGTITGARSVVLEGVASYDVASGVISGVDVLNDPANPWYADAVAFESNVPTLSQALGVANDARFSIRPGVELVASGDLSLASDWNLFDWRFGASGALPGTLTLRAAGTISFDASLNDGFADPFTGLLPDVAGESWSYRIAAGAALDSANPLATQRHAGTNPGNVIVGPGIAPGAPGLQRVVRTGTGDIDIAASGDLVLANQASVIYTAGMAGPGVRIPEIPIIGGLESRAYPIGSGSLSIDVGRDVVGARSTQLYTEWLWRSGASGVLPTTTAWTVAFDQFEQGIGSFGGGAVSVLAGGDIRDLSASVPSIGRQVGGLDPQQNDVRTTAGGDLTVRAGGSLLGGQFYVDRGEGLLAAGEHIGAPGTAPGETFGPLLAIGDATMSVRARGDVAITSAINPTLLAPVDMFGAPLDQTYFGTYSADSRVSLLSTGGSIDFMRDFLLANNGRDIDEFVALHPFFTPLDEPLAALRVLPPSLDATALSGDVRTGGDMILWPAARGDLRMLAAGNVDLNTVTMSDAAIGQTLPTPQRPSGDAPSFVRPLTTRSDSTFHANVPVHAAAGDQPADDTSALIVALEGDVRGLRSAEVTAAGMYLPKQLRVLAGRDVVDFGVQIQHFSDSNVSTIEAGRDVIFTSGRDPNGRLLPNQSEIAVDGPGRLELIAGRNVDLATSKGVVSTGNIRNPALPASGAQLSIAAGLNGHAPAYDAFIAEYLEGSNAYDAALLDYMTRRLGAAPATKSAALTAFRSLGRAAQRSLLEQVLFAELRAGGKIGAAPGKTHDDYSRAFAALESYFPGANPDLDGGETNAYGGNVGLFFSRVYTLAGGDINLLVPGGGIDVGLATPPAGFGLTKAPQELGIVAQQVGSISALSYGDFQVNESRAFAADGGDILVWSTRGDIDAGRGAKTAISAPPPVVRPDPNGGVRVEFPPALSGSGIQTLATTPGKDPGDVDLFAPRGVVNASDAGIVAGNLTIGATAVLGADNIQVSGVAVGVPVETSGLGVSLAGASSVASSASSAAASMVDSGGNQEKQSASLADAALSWLEVFVVGLGDETCRQDDVECLKRQKDKQ